MFTRTLLFLLFIGLGISTQAQSDSDVLMTVGGNDVTVGEFKYIYEKNNGNSADYSQESIEEYLDLYKKFKLKVAKAKDMKLDTIMSLQKELAGYRKQLATSFLTDKEVFDKLITEIVERKKEDVRISHILVKVNPRSIEKEKKEAVKRLQNFKQQLREGKSFSDLARQFSEDNNTKKNGGDLGFITAALPNGFYELENAAYNLEVGAVSDPIYTKLGYHIIKKTDKRAARGKIEVAHIFKKLPKNATKNPASIKNEVDSIYAALQNGASWGQMVKKHSEDQTTLSKGGKLPIFGIGIYDKMFEDKAFGLANDGDICEPIKSSVGYHILKRISKPEPKSVEDLKVQYKDKIRKYDRYTVAQEEMIEKIKKSSKFSENRQVLDKFTKSLNEDFFSYKWKPDDAIGTKTLLSFGTDSKQSISDFSRFAKRQTRLRSKFEKKTPLADAVEEIYQEFIKEKAYQYEQANLEEKYPEFRSLMREYQEGILLFEATKMNVWDKANTDTIGLYNFYEVNRSKYVFEEKAKVGKYIINSTDKKLIKKIMKCAKRRNAEKTLKRFNKDGKNLIEYTEAFIEPGHKDLIGLTFKKKSMSEPIIDTKNNKSLFKKVISISPSRRKTLKEARGYVVADYQDQLEQKWIMDLKKQYPIKVNNDIVKSLFK